MCVCVCLASPAQWRDWLIWRWWKGHCNECDLVGCVETQPLIHWQLPITSDSKNTQLDPLPLPWHLAAPETFVCGKLRQVNRQWYCAGEQRLITHTRVQHFAASRILLFPQTQWTRRKPFHVTPSPFVPFVCPDIPLISFLTACLSICDQQQRGSERKWAWHINRYSYSAL